MCIFLAEIFICLSLRNKMENLATDVITRVFLTGLLLFVLLLFSGRSQEWLKGVLKDAAESDAAAAMELKTAGAGKSTSPHSTASFNRLASGAGGNRHPAAHGGRCGTKMRRYVRYYESTRRGYNRKRTHQVRTMPVMLRGRYGFVPGFPYTRFSVHGFPPQVSQVEC